MKSPELTPEDMSGVCTVCDLPLSGMRTALAGLHRETSYPFCSQKCLKEFYKDPERYLFFEAEDEVVE